MIKWDYYTWYPCQCEMMHQTLISPFHATLCQKNASIKINDSHLFFPWLLCKVLSSTRFKTVIFFVLIKLVSIVKATKLEIRKMNGLCLNAFWWRFWLFFEWIFFSNDSFYWQAIWHENYRSFWFGRSGYQLKNLDTIVGWTRHESHFYLNANSVFAHLSLWSPPTFAYSFAKSTPCIKDFYCAFFQQSKFSYHN